MGTVPGPAPVIAQLLNTSGFFLLNAFCAQHLWFLVLLMWLFHLTGLYSLSCTLYKAKTITMIMNPGLGLQGMK